MAEFVTMTQARKRWYELVERAANGEEIVISKWGRPLARLIPLATPAKRAEAPTEPE